MYYLFRYQKKRKLFFFFSFQLRINVNKCVWSKTWFTVDDTLIGFLMKNLSGKILSRSVRLNRQSYTQPSVRYYQSWYRFNFGKTLGNIEPQTSLVFLDLTRDWASTNLRYLFLLLQSDTILTGGKHLDEDVRSM